jgi:hypothetical protein
MTQANNQKWKVIYLDKHTTQTKGLLKEFGFHIDRPFYMVSRLPLHRVAEAVGASNVQLRRYVKGRVAQQFFFDGVSKTIKSQQWKNYCVEIQSNGGNKNVRMTSGINSRWWQLFRYEDALIVNEKGKVFDVEGG